MKVSSCLLIAVVIYLVTSAYAAEIKAVPVCATYYVDYPTSVAPGSIKLWDDFSMNDYANIAGVAAVIAAIVGPALGLPIITALGFVNGFLAVMVSTEKGFMSSNTQVQDVAMDLYVNPFPSMSTWCNTNDPAVKDFCISIPVNAKGPWPFFYGEFDYITMKSCCDVDKCITLTGTIQCINAWGNGGGAIPLSTVIQCTNKYSSGK